MLPAHRGSVGGQRGIGRLADRTQMLDCIGDVGGIPVHDRGDDQVQPEARYCSVSCVRSIIRPWRNVQIACVST